MMPGDERSSRSAGLLGFKQVYWENLLLLQTQPGPQWCFTARGEDCERKCVKIRGKSVKICSLSPRSNRSFCICVSSCDFAPRLCPLLLWGVGKEWFCEFITTRSPAVSVNYAFSFNTHCMSERCCFSLFLYYNKLTCPYKLHAACLCLFSFIMTMAVCLGFDIPILPMADLLTGRWQAVSIITIHQHTTLVLNGFSPLLHSLFTVQLSAKIAIWF